MLAELPADHICQSVGLGEGAKGVIPEVLASGDGSQGDEHQLAPGCALLVDVGPRQSARHEVARNLGGVCRLRSSRTDVGIGQALHAGVDEGADAAEGRSSEAQQLLLGGWRGEELLGRRHKVHHRGVHLHEHASLEDVKAIGLFDGAPRALHPRQGLVFLDGAAGPDEDAGSGPGQQADGRNPKYVGRHLREDNERVVDDDGRRRHECAEILQQCREDTFGGVGEPGNHLRVVLVWCPLGDVLGDAGGIQLLQHAREVAVGVPEWPPGGTCRFDHFPHRVLHEVRDRTAPCGELLDQGQGGIHVAGRGL
mmetsp:Transcript_133350/g.426385  ORF Transcript_133350/g.426385 Transcript_133350/m.426385 type:complete len:310 (+) Transcript_133350:968-1897(+)